MYNKLSELCKQMDKLTMDELHNTDLKALVILAVSNDCEAISFSKGKLADILALLGCTISKIAKDSNLSIGELLYIINENETMHERLRKRKEGV